MTMRYSIKENGEELKITAEGLRGKQPQLIEQLKACAEGRCSCSTPQYAKLEAIEIAPGTDKVDISLRAKPGEKIDQADIARCLDETAKKVDG